MDHVVGSGRKSMIQTNNETSARAKWQVLNLEKKHFDRRLDKQ
jgi:hypothetical protein